MKKLAIAFLIILAILVAGGYYIYQAMIPKIVAKAVISDSASVYIPKRFRRHVEEIRKPLNRGTEAMINKMHAAELPLEEVIQAVDDITEEQAYAFIDEMNQRQPTTTDQVFDLAVKHFPTDFDPEIFREPFNDHFDMTQIRRALVYANFNRQSQDIDMATAKAIVKNILIEKSKDLGSE